jgi:hypothetical protein
MRMATFHTYERENIPDHVLHDAAKLFSDNYGVWGPVAEQKRARSLNMAAASA